MPSFDGTGPAGQGPMTGRAAGYCALPLESNQYSTRQNKNMTRAFPVSNAVPPYNTRQVPRRGYAGRGRGAGRGRRRF
ncbi:MAG: DUF5320 domain-containing protein [Actinomycetota bacterium]